MLLYIYCKLLLESEEVNVPTTSINNFLLFCSPKSKSQITLNGWMNNELEVIQKEEDLC